MCLTTLFWLALLGAFLLGLLLGWWIWGNFKSMLTRAYSERDDYKSKYERLRKEPSSKDTSDWKSKYESMKRDHAGCLAKLSDCNSKVESLQREHAKCSTKTVVAAAAPVAAVASSFAAAKPSKPDDLKKVEGIGPKIEEIINKNGVKTWAQLAKTDPADIKKWLDEAGPRFKMHKPGSWPKQAGMAAEGKWDELEKWQGAHKGGVE